MAESNPVIPFPHPTAADFIGTDDDVHGFKSQGRGDLNKMNAFEDPKVEFQEYPKHYTEDGKTYSIASEGAEPVMVAEEPSLEAPIAEPEVQTAEE